MVGYSQDEIRKAAQIMASLGAAKGGRSRSEKKIAAVRLNGKKGGRPRGSKNKVINAPVR